MPLQPTQMEEKDRNAILQTILDSIRNGITLKLPPFDRNSRTRADFALLAVASEPNALGGRIGEFLYQFEGEEDLLHLFIVRNDGCPFAVEEAQGVAEFVLPGVPPAYLFLKPGNVSHHFYVGHDFLLETLCFQNP